MGSCFEGYEGVLCAACAVGYSRSSDFKCDICPDPTVNMIRLGIIFIGVIGGIVFLIRSTLAGAS